MTPDSIVRSLTEPRRMRVLAAVALGADTPAKVAQAAGLPPRDAMTALHRLRDGGLVVADGDGLRVAYEELRELAKQTTAGEPEDAGDDQAIRPFVRAGRLLALPAQQARRRTVLEHIAETSFEPGTSYDERAVDDKLRVWCDGGEVDHVSIRRYLIDAKILVRANGVYARTPEAVPDRGVAERYVTAIGLD